MSEITGIVRFERDGLYSLEMKVTLDEGNFKPEGRVFAAFLAMLRDARLNEKVFVSTDDFVSEYLHDHSHTYNESSVEERQKMVDNFIALLGNYIPNYKERTSGKKFIDIIYAYDFVYLEPFVIDKGGYKALFSILNHLSIYEPDFIRLLEGIDLK